MLYCLLAVACWHYLPECYKYSGVYRIYSVACCFECCFWPHRHWYGRKNVKSNPVGRKSVFHVQKVSMRIKKLNILKHYTA